MDDVLKKAMFTEVQDLMQQIEEVVNKYRHSGDLVYTAAFGLLEEETENTNNWSLAYGHNCRDLGEFSEFMQLQVKAFTDLEDDGPEDFLTQFSLN